MSSLLQWKVYVWRYLKMGKMSWESAKREMETLYRIDDSIKLSINIHAHSYILPYVCRDMNSNQNETVNIAPSKKGTTALLIEIIKNGSLEGRQWAEKELIRITPEEWD